MTVSRADAARCPGIQASALELDEQPLEAAPAEAELEGNFRTVAMTVGTPPRLVKAIYARYPTAGGEHRRR